MNLRDTYDPSFLAFLKSNELGTSILANTQAKRERYWAKGYAVILFPCGKFKVVNRDSNPRQARKNRLTVAIPRIEREDWFSDEPLFFAAIDVLHCNYAYAVKDSDLLLQYLSNMITRFNLLFTEVTDEDLASLNSFLKQIPILDRELARKDTLDFCRFLSGDRELDLSTVGEKDLAGYRQILRNSIFQSAIAADRKIQTAQNLVDFLAAAAAAAIAG